MVGLFPSLGHRRSDLLLVIALRSFGPETTNDPGDALDDGNGQDTCGCHSGNQNAGGGPKTGFGITPAPQFAGYKINLWHVIPSVVSEIAKNSVAARHSLLAVYSTSELQMINGVT